MLGRRHLGRGGGSLVGIMECAAKTTKKEDPKVNTPEQNIYRQ